jgi:O-Antigen ligase
VSPSITSAARFVPSFSRLSPMEESFLKSPIRKLGFYISLGMIFLEFSRLHETLAFVSGINTFVLYLFAVPAIVAVAISGGLSRVLKEGSARFWLLFTSWMALAIPFSFWRGGSTTEVLVFVRVVVPVLFVTAGLAMTWSEFRKVLYVIAFGGMVIMATSQAFLKDYGSRSGVEYGIIGNPNDFAVHLILLLPFFLFIVICRGDWLVLGNIGRLAGAGCIVFGLYLALSTGSRGALAALAASALFVIWKSPMKARVGMILLLPLIAVALTVTLPRQTLDRLMSFSTEAGGPSDTEEARYSAASRQHLFNESVRLSFTHPVFGVGPGQFGSYLGFSAREKGTRDGWFNTHNSFTQVSSECGLPALFFYLAAVIGTFAILREVGRAVRGKPEFKEVQVACFCLALSLFGLLVAMLFVNFGYFFYLPAFTGLAISLRRSVRLELDSRPNPQAGMLPALVPAMAGAPSSVPRAEVPVTRRSNPYRFGRVR